MSGERIQSGDHSSVIFHECIFESEYGYIYVAATEISRAEWRNEPPACRDKADACGVSAEYEL